MMFSFFVFFVFLRGVQHTSPANCLRQPTIAPSSRHFFLNNTTLCPTPRTTSKAKKNKKEKKDQKPQKGIGSNLVRAALTPYDQLERTTR